jgi:hypothetical protein
LKCHRLTERLKNLKVFDLSFASKIASLMPGNYFEEVKYTAVPTEHEVDLCK